MLSSPSSQQLLPLDSSTPSFGASKPCTEPVAATGARPTGESVSKDRLVDTNDQSCLWGKVQVWDMVSGIKIMFMATSLEKGRNAWFQMSDLDGRICLI